jgi:hypothetical protein
VSRPSFLAISALAVLVIAAAGYWLHAAWDKHADEQRLNELLRTTTEELRRGLADHASPELVEKIDDNLQAAQSPRNPRFAEAAGLYILGAREIVRRRVEAERLQREAARSRAALAAHMKRSSRRNDAWFRGALELKQRVEREHRDLEVTLKVLDELLYSLPDSERELAPHVAPAVLLQEAERRAARDELQLEAKRAAAALEKARGLAVR